MSSRNWNISPSNFAMAVVLTLSALAGGGPELLVVMVERGPTTLSCDQILSEEPHPTWVRLAGCEADIRSTVTGPASSFPPFRPARFVPLRGTNGLTGRRPLYWKVPPAVRWPPAATRPLTGLMDIRGTGPAPTELDRQAIIVDTALPRVIAVATPAVAILLWVVFGGRALLRAARRRDAPISLQATIQSRQSPTAETGQSPSHAAREQPVKEPAPPPPTPSPPGPDRSEDRSGAWQNATRKTRRLRVQSPFHEGYVSARRAGIDLRIRRARVAYAVAVCSAPSR